MANIPLPPPPPSPFLPCMAGLNFPYLKKLINHTISHDDNWLDMPTKLLFDIPKFEGKANDDPTNHVMSFHLWYSSNKIIQDSIHLFLFQPNLMGPTSEWYVEKLIRTYITFEGLAKIFLSFFQLPM